MVTPQCSLMGPGISRGHQPPKSSTYHRLDLRFVHYVWGAIGALVKTLANDGPEAHLRLMAHSMRPNF